MNKLEQKIKEYSLLRQKIKAFYYVNYMISWDSETEAPIGCFEERSKQVGVLSEMLSKLMLSKKNVKLMRELYEAKDQLPELLRVEIIKEYKNINKKLLVPTKEMTKYEMLLASSGNVWTNAKINNDYSLFKDTLKQIIDFNMKYVDYVKTDQLQGYDVLLDEYEDGATQAFYDKFFSELRKEIVPLVQKIKAKGYNYNTEFIKNKYDITKQKEFASYLMDVMCFDKTRGLIKESEHPFTSGFGTTDVRITNHYYEDLLTSSIFSVIHEAGHGTYELQCDSALDDTLIGGGSTMAMHESQSRFYENIIGRSSAFWETHYHTLQKLYPKELRDVTLNDFYHYVNIVDTTLIRTEADELTYPLHIMVRYEIEKMIFNKEITVDELPQKWNELYKEYLGIDVPNDAQGILQDIHWAGGSFGYFPTYALGSAYAAQIYYAMKKDLDIDEAIKEGTLQKINNWLKERVHRFGASKTPKEILVYATGEEFNPKYYVKYLKEKYAKIYDL